MQTGDHTQSSSACGDAATGGGGREPSQPVSFLVPVPGEEDVAGFIALYRERYGVELEPGRAHEILGGLMRFLYLTGRAGAGATRQPGPHTVPLDGARTRA